VSERAAFDRVNGDPGALLDLRDETLVARGGEGEEIGEAAQEQPRLSDWGEQRRGGRVEPIAQREHRRGGT
jgi:hypothetical protein